MHLKSCFILTIHLSPLKNGLVDHLLTCFSNENIEGLESYQYELASKFSYHWQGIQDVGTYIYKM